MAKDVKFYDNPEVAKKTKENLRSDITSSIRNKVNQLMHIDKDIDNSKEAINEIAGFHLDKIFNIQDTLSKSTILVGSDNKKAFPDLDTTVAKAHKQLYEKLDKGNFFNDIAHAFGTKKDQSGSQLIDNVVKYNKFTTNRSLGKQNTMNWEATYNNILELDKVKKQGGHLITFDTETLSGKNNLGHNALEHITEISATVHEIKDGKMTRSKRIDSVLGLDNTQYNAAIKRLEEIEARGVKNLERGSSDAVFFDRMNIYSTAKTQQDGFEFHVSEAKGIDDIETSIEKARKGIENLRSVGKQQETWVRNNISPTTTLNAHQRKYVANINDLISTGSYNGKTYNDYIVLGQNSSVFDIPKMQLFGGNTVDTKRHLDLYQANMFIQDTIGADKLLPQGVKTSGKYGRATQENLSSALGYKVSGKAAHIAQTDQEELARMMIQGMSGDSALIAKETAEGVYNVSNNSYLEHLVNNAKSTNKSLKATKSTYDNSGQLFYMDYTQQKNWADKEGSLSFAYDATSGKYKTFDGYNVTGGVTNTGYQQYGARNGTLVTHEVVQANTTEQFKDLFKNIPGISEEEANELFQNISNSQDLYLVKTQEYIDKQALEKKVGKEQAEFFMKNQRTTYTIETNKDRLGANLGIHVGDIDSKGITNLQEDAIKSLGLTKTEMVGDVVNSKALGVNESVNALVDKTLNRTINDSAARNVRDLDYKKISKLIAFEDKYSNKQITNPISHHALQYSEAVSKGKPVDLAIQNELGHIFNGQKKITPETVRNSVALESYIQEMSPVFKEFENILDERYGKFDITKYDKRSNVQKEKYIQREMGFKQLLNDYTLEANKTNGGVHTARDLNKIDFKTSNIFPKEFNSQIGRSSNANIENITTIDLNNQNSLLNTFFDSKFKDAEDRVVKNSAAGWTALSDAQKAFRNDERFKGLWQVLNVNDLRKEGYSVVQANDIMMDKIRSFTNSKRIDDSSFGLLHARNVQDVISTDSLKGLGKSLDETTRTNVINKIKTNLPKEVKLVTASFDPEGKKIANENVVNKLVDDYFMGYSKSDFEKSLDGYNKEQQKVLRLQDKINRRTANEYANDLASAIAGEDNLAYMVTQTKNGAPILNLVHDGKVTELNAQRFTLNKGISTSTIGSNEYVNRLALGINQKNKVVSPILTSTSEKARVTKSMQKRIKWANDRGDSVADTIIRTVKDRSKGVAEATTRVDFSNGQLFAQAFELDVNDMVRMLPKFEADGTLERVEKAMNIPTDSRDIIRGLSKQVATEKYKFDDKAFGKVLPRELNHFMFYYKGLLNEVQDQIEIPGVAHKDRNYYSSILNNVGQKTKTTALRTGKDSLDATYYMDAFGVIDDEHRPPMTQMANSVLYDKDEVAEKISKIDGISAKSGPVATNNLAEKFLYNNDGNAGKGTSGLSMKFLQTDSYKLQDMFLDDKNNGSDNMKKFLGNKNNFGEGAAEKIYERATSLSTYEQQGLINARVSDAAFHKINTQKISATKEMILNLDSDLETLAYVKNATKLQFQINDKGEVVYQNGSHVRAGDTLGRFGNADFSENKIAKYDGIFRGRFFDNQGKVVDAGKVNDLLKANKVAGETATREWLSQNLDFKYEVMPLREMHGMKVFMGPSEKTTTDSLKMGVGTLDKGLTSELDKLGFGNLSGSVTYTDYLFGDVKEGLGKAGRLDLFNRILDERYALSDYMQEFDKLKGVGFISAVNIDKHNSVSVLMQSFMSDLQDKGMITDDNMKTMFGKGNYKILDNGRVEILPSMSKINTNFEEGSDLAKTWGITLSNFKEGKGTANIVQGYDDIAGTFAGDAKTLNDNINLLDRNIRKVDNVNKDIEKSYGKVQSLLQEKSELEQVISDMDAKSKAKRDELLDKINRNIEDVKNVMDQNKDKADEWYKEKKKIHELLVASDSEMSYNDPYKVDLRNKMQLNDELIAENKEALSGFHNDIKALKAEKKSVYDQYSGGYKEERIRLDEINKELNTSKVKDLSTGQKISIGDLDTPEKVEELITRNNSVAAKSMKERMTLEAQANAMDDFKGVKFSNQMGLNLDRTTFNPDLVKKLQTELDDATFQKYYGYAMDGNVIKSEYLGTSMADPITSRLRGQLSSQDGAIKLKDIDSDPFLRDQYGYLVDAIKNSGGEMGDVSVKSAENMYSYSQGLKAMQYNESYGYKARQELVNSKLGGFKEIDFNDLELDIAGQGKQIVNSDLNPYTNNLIIKTGLSDKYSELAIARMPEVHAGDSLIKKEHVKQLSTLKDKLTQYHMADNADDRATYLKNAQDQISYIKQLQKADVTSKTGLIKDGTEFRMNQSFFGKASGINVNSYIGDRDLFGILKGDEESITRLVDYDLTAAEVRQTLVEKNARLAKAEFNGKSLLDHYAEGKLIDSAFASEKMFENLGYFDEDTMAKTFNNLSDDYKTKLSGFDLGNSGGQRDAMKHLLSTEGDSFVTVRYPEIMAGSDKFATVYLDDALKDNQIMVMGATGMSAKLDHDGDQFAASLVTTSSGDSKLIANMTGGDAESELMTRALDSSMVTRAATDNMYWENQVKEHIMKERKFATSVSDMKQVAGKRAINGEIYTSKITDPNLTLENLVDLKDKYKEVLKIDKKDFKGMKDADLVEQIVSASKGLNEEYAINEYMAAWSYADTEDMITAKIYQNAVGETNVTNQKVKSIVTDLMDKTTDNYEYKQQILSDFLYRAEEGAISSKSSVEGLEPDRAKNWNDAVTGVLNGDNVIENKKTMRNWLQENVQDQAFIESYYARSSHFSDTLSKDFGVDSYSDLKNVLDDEAKRSKILSRVTDDVVDTISEFSGHEGMKEKFSTLRLGVSQTGTMSSVALNPLFVEGTMDNTRAFYETGSRLYGESFGSMGKLEAQSMHQRTGGAFRESVEELVSNASETVSRVSTEDKLGGIIEGVGDFAKSIKGKNLAMGAIGIAAGIMVAGYVGGRPRPADVHAMEEATDYQTPMEGYQLADPGLMGGSSSQQGYVININARTRQGKNNAAQALQQAISSGTSSSINVAMNITDNYGNINDRQIEEAIMGAF